MSSPRGAAGRGRARGRGSGNNAARGASSSRGRLPNTGVPRGSSTPRALFGAPARGNATSTAGGKPRMNGLAKQHSSTTLSAAQARGSWQDRYEKLEKDRKRERAQAIAEGSIADPDKPRTLSEAITPVGRCMDMCAEYERVQRVVQKDIWPEETDPGRSVYSSSDREPDEARMVKKFRRAAAGIDEQLPSDLRPPNVLKRTCDFLFDEVIANAPDLGNVHHFVWDRTRAIRNDFTILQVSTPQDLSLAVDCFERIARFHILSLHQMAVEEKPYFAYDWQQDREQLDRTLLSLMQYYDDSRGKVPLPNEPEFRAYLVVFQLQDPVPDLEDRVQSWPIEIVKHPRVRKALTLYAAACNTLDVQGPLKPGAPHVIAQQDWQRFWNLVGSTRTSYLMACMAELYFNLIRRTALQSLIRSTNQRSSGDSTIDDLCNMLAFDTEEEVEGFCSRYNISFADSPDGQRIIDLSALKNRHILPEPSPAPPKQMKSLLVEEKRFGRTFPAIINGLSVKEAQEAGMIDETAIMEDETMEENSADIQLDGSGKEITTPANDEESLFIPGNTKTEKSPTTAWPTTQPSVFDLDKPKSSTLGQTTGQQQNNPFSFGTASLSTFGTPASGVGGTTVSNKSDVHSDKPKFNFLSTTAEKQSSLPASNPLEIKPANGFLGFNKALSPAPDQGSAFGGFDFSSSKSGGEAVKPAPSTGFGSFNFTSTSAAGGDTNNEAPQSSFSQPTKPPGSPQFSFAGKSNGQPLVPTPTFSMTAQTAKTPLPPEESSESEHAFSTPPSTDTGAKPAALSFGSGLSGAPTAAPTTNPSPSVPPSLPNKQPGATLPQSSNFNFLQPPKPASTPISKAPEPAQGQKSSASDLFNKPKFPSPLAQTFTFGNAAASEEPPKKDLSEVKQPYLQFGNDTTAKEGTFAKAPPPEQQPNSDLFPERQSNTAQSKLAKSSTKKTTLPEPDFTSVVSEIARYITLDPISGLLDQYIDFIAGKVITDVQESLYFERVNAEADDFRTTVLSHRYGKLWRDVCRHRRLARRGKDRRRRNQQRLLESKSQASETVSLADSESFFGGSRRESIRGSVLGESHQRQEMVDKKYQQSMGSGRWSRMVKEDQARGGSKRPSSSHGAEGPAVSIQNDHKRLKSTSRINGAGHIIKPTATSNPDSVSFQRSSFMGSLSGSAPLRSTTKTNYFKLKAMGQPAISDAANARARKRRHTEMSASPTGSSLNAPVLTPSSIAASPPTALAALQRRSSTASVKSTKTREDDDALFARLRAARENLKESTNFFQTEVTKADELRRSSGSYESPSLDRARTEVRWRASQSAAGHGAPGADVPAYRLRESKFIPRDNYGKAIERAREFRESRSGNSSRPESRTQIHDVSDTPTVLKSQPSRAAAQYASMKPSPINSFTPASKLPNGIHFAQNQTQQPAAVSAQPPISSMAHSGFTPPQQANMTFANFPLDAAEQPLDFNTESILPGFTLEPGDHTIQPSQIKQSLATSFGQRAAPSQVQSSFQTNFACDPTAQENSYVLTESVIVNKEINDDDLQITSTSTPYVNGNSTRSGSADQRSEALGEEGSQSSDSREVQGHPSPYAALDNGFGEEEDEAQWDEVSHAHSPNSHQYGAYPPPPTGSNEFDEEDDGDIEDEDGEGYDEDEEYDETEEATEEDEDLNQYFESGMLHGQSQPRISPATNPALATQGETEGDAIELSD